MELQETWDLEVIFAGGARSPELAEFLSRLEQGIAALPEQVAALGDAPQEWAAAIAAWQQRAAELAQAFSFVECLTAADTADAVATQLGGRLDALDARLKTIEAAIDQRLLRLSDAAWRRVVEQPGPAAVAFFLERQRTLARRKMEPEREALAETLAANGYHAWSRLYDKLAGSLRAEVDAGGARRSLSMGQLAHRLEDPDGAVRAAAFQGLDPRPHPASGH